MNGDPVQAISGETSLRRSRPPHHLGWFVLVLLAGMGLRLWDLGGPSFWVDEMQTQIRAQAPLTETLALVRESGNQTPFYYLILHAYPTGTIFALRSFSVLVGVLGIACLAFAVKRLYGRADLAVWAAALLAFNPYSVWLAHTARFYTLDFLLALLISYSFLWLLRHQNSRVHWLILIAASAAGYLTHYFMVALPLAQYITLGFVLRRRRLFFRRWLIAQVIAGIPFLAWIFYLMRAEVLSAGITISMPALRDIPLTFANMTVGYTHDLPWYALPGLALAAAGLILGAIRTVRCPLDQVERWYWFWLVVLTVACVFIASELILPVYSDRYFVLFLPALVILMLYGWDRLRHPRLKAAVFGVVALTGLFQIAGVFHSRDYYNEEWSQAARYIEDNFQAGDGVLSSNPLELILLKKYLTIPNLDYAWVSENDPLVITPFPKPVDRVWVVVRLSSGSGAHGNQLVMPGDRASDPITYVPPWVAARSDRLISQRKFNGLTVFLIDTRAEASELAEPAGEHP